MFMKCTYDQLQAKAKLAQHYFGTYITERSHLLTLGLNSPEDATKQVKQLFDEWDLLEDKQRPELIVWTNDAFISTVPELAVFSSTATGRSFP